MSVCVCCTVRRWLFSLRQLWYRDWVEITCRGHDYVHWMTLNHALWSLPHTAHSHKLNVSPCSVYLFSVSCGQTWDESHMIRLEPGITSDLRQTTRKDSKHSKGTQTLLYCRYEHTQPKRRRRWARMWFHLVARSCEVIKITAKRSPDKTDTTFLCLN